MIRIPSNSRDNQEQQRSNLHKNKEMDIVYTYYIQFKVGMNCIQTYIASVEYFINLNRIEGSQLLIFLVMKQPSGWCCC
jgi:hypothetical protein